MASGKKKPTGKKGATPLPKALPMAEVKRSIDTAAPLFTAGAHLAAAPLPGSNRAAAAAKKEKAAKASAAQELMGDGADGTTQTKLRSTLTSLFDLATRNRHRQSYRFGAPKILTSGAVSTEQVWGQLSTLYGGVLPRLGHATNAAAKIAKQREAAGLLEPVVGAGKAPKTKAPKAKRGRAADEPVAEALVSESESEADSIDDIAAKLTKKKKAGKKKGEDWRYAFGRGEGAEDDDDMDAMMEAEGMTAADLEDDASDAGPRKKTRGEDPEDSAGYQDSDVDYDDIEALGDEDDADLGGEEDDDDDLDLDNLDDEEGLDEDMGDLGMDDEGDDEDDLGEEGDEEGDEEGEEGEEDSEDERAAMREMYGDDYVDDAVEEDDDEGIHWEEDEEQEAFSSEEDDDEAAPATAAAATRKGVSFDEDANVETAVAATGEAPVEGEGEDEDDHLTGFQRAEKERMEAAKDAEETRLYGAAWSMKGEVGAKQRPKDSLLDEALDFEHGARTAPVITELFTAKLEDRIKKRISTSNYDDVQRKVLSTSNADLATSKRDADVDAQKSKQSLMDLYEKDFLEKQRKADEAVGQGLETAEPLTEIEKDELKAVQMWGRLAQHLDALTNFHFTPKPVTAELDVRVRATRDQAPAVSLESVGLQGLAKEAALAPQDVFRMKDKAAFTGVTAEEMKPEEKRALRRAKKAASITTATRKEKKAREVQAEKEKRSAARKAAAAAAASTR